MACGDDDGALDSSAPDSAVDSGVEDAGSDSAAADTNTDAATPDSGEDADDDVGNDGAVDASSDAEGDAADDSAVDAASDSASDATSDAMDAMDAMADVPSRDATVGDECNVNADCAADQRCECEDEVGCMCAIGVRGTGRNGIDACTSGNDCASALCVEGPEPADTFYCSDECESNDDCGGMLPRCIGLLGICARTPPG